MPKSAPPREDLLSVEEAADKLEVTERTVWNLIKKRTLVTEEIDGRVWISAVEINRYRLIYKDTHCDHVFSRFPSTAASNFQKYVHFGPWGRTGDYAQFELEVNLYDWMRLAVKPVDERAEYEKLRIEVRDRIGAGAPENFAVRFKINQPDLAETLKRAVYRVEVPKLPSHDDDEIRSMAMEHLLDHALLRIHGVKGDPFDYLVQAVRNFYIDLQRREYSRMHPEIAFGGPDEVEIQLIAATHRLSGRRGKRVDKKVNNDQLFQDLTRGDPAQSASKRKPRK